ncbi:MAG: ferrochelatase [Alphaproteobacteria bacterium]|nr:MAG: ferrochelatase [Alphaproteobacteria bacterium]
MSNDAHKVAVVVMNLGGPDSPDAVEPFLFNLFFDPQIIRLPTPLRWLIAKIISRRRAPVAREIYAHLGGKSPLLAETEAQARALEAELAARGRNARVFVAMRYWHPFTDEAAEAVRAFAPEEVVLLPLYPQFSTTTTQSSFMAWTKAARAFGLAVPTTGVCCYPTEPDFIAAHAALIMQTVEQADINRENARVLFSAHGLPRKVVDGGDPYARQVEATASAVVARLEWPDLDWRVTYQSRVGPLEWIGPDTEAEVAAAGREGKAIVVVPIAFVSEHSETLVELDMEYRAVAETAGAPAYVRIPALGINKSFIAALANVVEAALERRRGDSWTCPAAAICFKDKTAV